MNSTKRTALGIALSPRPAMARRAIALGVIIALATTGLVAGRAQQARPQGQGFVGVWSLINAEPSQAPTLLTVNADGTFITSQVAGGGNTPIHGVWEASGERSIRITGRWLLGDNKSFTYMGSGKITGTVELDSSGVFRSEAVVEGFEPSGKRMFAGPTKVKGFRLGIQNPPKT